MTAGWCTPIDRYTWLPALSLRDMTDIDDETHTHLLSTISSMPHLSHKGIEEIIRKSLGKVPSVAGLPE